MAERRATGGSKEFHYDKEDLERIRTTDTDSTRAFKEAAQEYSVRRREEREFERIQEHRMRLTFVVVGLGALVVLLLLIRFLK